MLEISEILYRWVKGFRIKEISKSLGYARNSIKKVIRQAKDLGLKQNDSIAVIDNMAVKLNKERSVPVFTKPTLATELRLYDDRIKMWLSEDDITITQIRRLICEYGLSVSDTSLRRYINGNFKDLINKDKKYTIPLVTNPADEGQVDYAYVGLMKDEKTGKMRKTHAFIMTLSYSRHRYVEFVFGQDIRSWIQCHINAFCFFGGVPNRILLDNLKAGVIKADIYDPTINRSYVELERFYGFVVDPAKARDPKAKGRVERSVQIVRQQLIAGRSYANINEANEAARRWCRDVICEQVTRTTGRTPKEMFLLEKPLLKKLPNGYFDIAYWQIYKVHKDHHIVCNGNFYSAPTAYIGLEVTVRIGLKTINIYYDNRLIKSHIKLEGRGNWQTDHNDYPQGVLKFLMKTKEKCLEEAKELGDAIAEVIAMVLDKESKRTLRKAQGILRLAEKYGKERLDNACLKAILYENYSYESISNCLKKNLEQTIEEAPPTALIANENNSYLRDHKQYASSTEAHYV